LIIVNKGEGFSEVGRSAGNVLTDLGELLVEVLLEFIDDADFSGSFGGTELVVLRFRVAPGGLGGEGLLDVFEFDLVVLEGVLELGEEIFSGGDEGGKAGLLVGEGGLLALEGGEEGFPVTLGLFLVLLGELLLLNDTGADVLEEIQNLDDGLVVELGGELGEGGNEGLEEGGVLVVGGSKLLEDLVVTGLDLGESDTVDHVLDELDAFLKGGDLDGLFVVIGSPFAVLGLTFGGALFDGFDGLVVVLVGLLELLLGRVEELLVVDDLVLDAGDGRGLVADL